MALTDHSDIYSALDEQGINHVVDQLRHKRPSLFNYGMARVVAGATASTVVESLRERVREVQRQR